MAVRYAVTSGSWSTGSIWDNGAVPVDGDDVYANGYNITIDQNINILKFSNRLSPVRVPDIATPAMTSNTTPSGVAFASGQQPNRNPWHAFDTDSGTFWQSNVVNTGIIGYQFPSGKIIKQYAFLAWSTNTVNPRAWTFQGSNDGILYTTIETVTAFTTAINVWYLRDVSANTTSYTYYRMNITDVQTAGQIPVIRELNMTESTGSVYGSIASGSFISTNNIQITTSTPISTAFPGVSGIVSATTGPAFIITGSDTVYMSGSIQGGDVTSGNGVRITNGGTLYITGSISSGNAGGGSTGNSGLAILTGNAFIRGNLRTNGDTGNTGGACVAINNGTASISGDLYSATNHSPISIGAGNAQVNFSGSAFILGTSTFNMQISVAANNTGTINYTGPVIGNNNAGIGLGLGTMTVNITGSVSTIGAAAGISSTVASTININGPITANNSAPGISSTSTTATVRVTGPLISSQNNINPVFSPRIQLISNSTPTYTLEIDTFPREVTFYDVAFTSSLPTQSNVRSGSLYGGSAEFSGSMVIPSTSSVRYGVPVDNITGSATLTPQDILNYATQNLTGSNTIGARLKNIATVQTTAATIAAFKGK
jgi:hypothetical protein